MLIIGSCLALIVLTTLVHYETLRALSRVVPRLEIPRRARLLAVIFAEFAAHSLEIALYGIALFALVRYFGVGALTGAANGKLMNFMYFSAETYTSLGYGDVLPLGPVRLMIGVEALNGLLLIGWSASYAYLSMERFWSD